MNIPKLLLKFLAEIVGTFIFILLIFLITSNYSGASTVAIPIGLSLAFSILLFGDFTGGHFNPIVSFAFFIKDPKLFTGLMLLAYIVAQMIGGVLALYTHNYIKSKM
jgi:glycerol uptake facilitator-like aquaporin